MGFNSAGVAGIYHTPVLKDWAGNGWREEEVNRKDFAGQRALILSFPSLFPAFSSSQITVVERKEQGRLHPSRPP